MQTISDLNTWTEVSGLASGKKYLLQATVNSNQGLDTKLVEVYWCQQEDTPDGSVQSIADTLECSGDIKVWVKSPCKVYISAQEVI